MNHTCLQNVSKEIQNTWNTNYEKFDFHACVNQALKAGERNYRYGIEYLRACKEVRDRDVYYDIVVDAYTQRGATCPVPSRNVNRRN